MDTHLFFQCSFLKRIQGTLITLCLIKNPKYHWEDVVCWRESQLKGKSMKSLLLCRLSLWSTVYHIEECN